MENEDPRGSKTSAREQRNTDDTKLYHSGKWQIRTQYLYVNATRSYRPTIDHLPFDILSVGAAASSCVLTKGVGNRILLALIFLS